MNNDKKLILEMLRDGKLTAEEAEKLLDAVDNTKKAYAQEEPQVAGDSKNDKKSDFYFDIDMDKIKETINNASSKINSEKINAFSAGLSENLAVLGKELESSFKDMFSSFKDFSTGVRTNTETIRTSHEIAIEDAYNIDIDFKAINGGVAIVASPDTDVAKLKVVCNYKANEVETGESLYDYYLENNTLSFSPKYTNISIDLECVLPEKKYGKVIITTKNGSINVGDLEAESFGLETVNGAISTCDVFADSIHATTVNGKISAEKSECNEFVGQTSNGKVNLTALKSNSTDIRTSNAKIIVSDLTSNDAIFKTSNGSVSLDGIIVDKILANSSNGRIELLSFDKEALKIADLSTSNASVTIAEIPDNKAVSFDLETSMGNIAVNKENLLYLKNQQANYGMKKVLAETLDFQEAHDDDKVTFKVRTSNGSIKIG